MKKKNTGILAGLTAMCSKVFASMAITPLYGPPQPLRHKLILSVFRVLSPILFLIGTIVYLKKSKSSKKKKIITIILFILLLVGIYYGIEFLLESVIW